LIIINCTKHRQSKALPIVHCRQHIIVTSAYAFIIVSSQLVITNLLQTQLACIKRITTVKTYMNYTDELFRHTADN